MSMSLDDLLASPEVGLPECTYDLCLSQKLRARVEELDSEVIELEAQTTPATRDENGESVGPPQKLTQGAPPRLAEARRERDEARDQARRHSGTLRLRAEDVWAWDKWRTENPARVTVSDSHGRPVAFNRTDEEYTYARCDSSALLARLGDFVISWNGEALSEDKWKKITAVAPGGALLKCVQLVVEMQEGEGIKAPPFLSSASSETGASATS